MASEDMSFFGLNRPEYVPATELFMSELAWSAVSDATRKAITENIAPGGFAYGSRATHKAIKATESKPRRSSETYAAASKKLEELTGEDAEDCDVILDTLLTEIETFASEKSLRSSAVPLTLGTSLLQDRRGITGKGNPANVAQILEQIYATGEGNGSASACWIGALVDARPTGIPAWIAATLDEILPQGCNAALEEIEAAKSGKKKGLRQPRWLRNQPTPFRWFARSWDALCNDGWIDAMPRRRFADWAACLTRTGVATAYLFEMHICMRMVASLDSEADPAEVVFGAIEESKRLLAWDDGEIPSAVDVGPSIKRLSYAGTSCQELLREFKDAYPELPAPSQYDSDEDGLASWLTDARSVLSPYKSGVAIDIATALDDNHTGSAKNTFETIRYSLLVRGGRQSTDLYGFMRQNGPYSCVNPGQEWLVTVASLCSSSPGQPARMADLSRSLEELGISAPTQTLVNRLESYGMARSSHDADDAIEIQPAF